MKLGPSLLCFVVLSSLVVSCGKKAPPRWVEPVPPPAPTALSAVIREDAVVLGWDYPEGGAEGFTILRAASGAEFQEIAVLKEQAYIDRDFLAGVSYTYSVEAVGRRGMKSGSSNLVEASPPSDVAPPSGLSFSIRESVLDLSWERPPGDGMFNIYKSAGQEAYPIEPVNSEPIAGASFRDILSPEATVYYSVRVVEQGASGAVTRESAPLEIRVRPEDYVPSAPAGLGAAVAEGKAMLYWDENPETWVRGYRVYRAAGGGEFVTIGESRTPAFKDPEPLEGTMRYRVGALGPVSESSLSGAIAVSP